MEFLAQLDDLAVLRITGDDAVDFLHSQLSNDISALGADEARLAAYCSPKGRMLGSMVLWRETAEAASPLLALLKADLTDALLKRLRMFVLRAKVVFEETSLQGFGLSLLTAEEARRLGDAADAPALGSGPAWRVLRHEGLTFIAAPAASGGPSRWWLIDPQGGDAAALSKSLGLERQAASRWQAQDIEAGLGWAELGNQELFIPQSLNYDLNGGVSFTKGCYPGQEVVARAHFRGAVKRRGLPGFCELSDEVQLQAGMDVFDAKRPGSPAGRIINAASGANVAGGLRGWHVFMEISLADIGVADFRALSADGPAIRQLPLPYSLDDEAAK